MTKFKVEVVSNPTRKKNIKSVSEGIADAKKHYQEVNQINNELGDKVDRIRKERQEASRMVSMANKRLRRLEANNLESSQAYQMFIAEGGQYFSVRGKTGNQLQAEIARMRRFINAKTSTITGINNHLKEVADITGMEYKTLKELRAKAPKFFELQSKVEQYLRDVEDVASAIDYNKIWEAINSYVSKAKVDLADSKTDIDSMIADVTDALLEYEKPVSVGGTVVRLRNE